MNYTKSEQIFINQLGLSQWNIEKPIGNLWKAKGKKIYISHKRHNAGAIEYLKGLNFIKSANDAGGPFVIEIILK